MSAHLTSWLPLGFFHWPPIAQAITLALLTFVQEDIPTVGSALLAAAGKMGWWTGFLGCFFGIWLGDAGLYWLARGIGRPLLEKKWARRFFDPTAVARSEKWFAQKGTWLLISSRFIPGTRLPTYLAAGFLRLSFLRFLAITGSAVAFWTITIFVLARIFGEDLIHLLERWNHSGWMILLAVVALVFLVRLIPKLFQRDFWRRTHGRIGRWTRWEFWPPWLFYAPVTVYYGWLAIRYRGFTVPTAANPGILTGGMVGESKIETLKQLTEHSPEFTAEAFLIGGVKIEERIASLEELRARHGIDFPFIIKPNNGQRGLGVRLMRNAAQVENYFRALAVPLVLQRYAPGPHEAGIFYYRFPNETRGHIFAITEKLFPVLIGNGKNTIEELIWQDRRARFMSKKYFERLGERRQEILTAGEKIKLVEAGNHAQGCIFRDGKDLCSPELEARIDAISKGVPGFFIGRYDLRYSSAEELKAGKNFKIIELNGASSEATNIYDERNTLWNAYRTLFKQWNLVFAIGAANRRLGSAPMELWPLLKHWRASYQELALLPLAD
jgi:membrane protein DedA with SNARE-associated domain